ncbi:hypothetical protein CARUB_v10027272mg [Capsella rubella]|uniref:HMA domain-containing protein n=1 Tax=Capsella rubella TaxID=81985 RepID=R0EXX7_9BRAS|nr:uncharacterized protein LOC17876778 [Capsella rubella]EOA14127.1 hypothetical protein CARUB_v10027272mg [Capsella rubella]
MQGETVKFKMDVSDQNIKREAMRVVWMFSGVIMVDVEELGIVKVKGIFDKIEMRIKLQEIDNSVDIIIPVPEHEHSFLIPPKLKFPFKALNVRLIRDAMEVIWEFPGVTSVEVNKDDVQLEVNDGDFDKIAMAAKLKDIDENVSVGIKAGPDDVQTPDNGTS